MDLAVVIPAYRGRYLGQAVRSLRDQTDRGFRLYVGDDASPDDLESVVAEAWGGRPYVYRRFPENLGRRDLVGHWHRCLALTGGERWLWLFSDDDVAEPGCVAAWRRTVAEGGGQELLRFQMDLIGADGELLQRPVAHPAEESCAGLVRALLTDRHRQWRVPDHVFARAAYERHGGFLPFAKALYADFATWMLFSHPHGVRTIEGARVRWRSHGAGTSTGLRGAHRRELLDGLLGLAGWVSGFAARTPGLDPAEVARCARSYVRKEVRLMQPALSLAEVRSLARAAAGIWGGPLAWHALLLGASAAAGRARYWPGLQALASWRYRRGLARAARTG